MRTVLFICTHNAVRSQMAEGLVNALYPRSLRASSAGTRPGKVHPLAIRALAEESIDISSHSSKGLDEFKGFIFDHVITVCDSASEECPFFPGGREMIHHSFADPSNLIGSEEERLQAFRKTRDDIRLWLEQKFGPPDGD